ncbi:MAG: hypothetical protein J1F17_03530 [Oscillospiraceae bacterium]|nr:hypothetical protein [Oscillospiraceae bacterium]
MSNQINLGEIYVLTGDPEERCIRMNSDIIDFPTLEEIAPYDMRYNSGMNNTESISFDGIEDGVQATMNMNVSSADQNMNASDNMNNSSSGNQTGTTDIAFSDGNMEDNVTFTNENSPQNTASGYMVPISSPMRTSLSIGESPAIQEFNQPYRVNSQSIQYLNSFMRTQIGRMIEVNFLLGSQNMMNLEGRLLAVGANFILINERNSNNATTIDFYNIKYIRFRY